MQWALGWGPKVGAQYLLYGKGTTLRELIELIKLALAESAHLLLDPGIKIVFVERISHGLTSVSGDATPCHRFSLTGLAAAPLRHSLPIVRP